MKEIRSQPMDLMIFLKEYTTPLLAIIAGLYSFKYFDSFWRTLFLQVVVYVVVIKIVYEITPGIQTNSNHWFYNGYVILEMALLCVAAFFYFDTVFARRTLLLLFLFYLIIYSSQLYTDGVDSFANYGFAAGGLVLTIVYGSILYMEVRENDQWVKSPEIWASMGLLVFFTCNIPYFSLFKYLNKNYLAESKFLFHFITDVLANVRYLFVAVSFYLVRKNFIALKN